MSKDSTNLNIFVALCYIPCSIIYISDKIIYIMKNIRNTLHRVTVLRKAHGMLRRICPVRTKQPMGREFLLKIVPKYSVCAEIGVWEGAFSAKILRLTNPKKLHLIDPWHHEEGDTYATAKYGGKIGSQKNIDEIYGGVLNRFEPEIKSGIISIHRKTSEDACYDFPDNYFDWIYIDGNHLYEFAKKDLENYYRKVKEGGFITGDDYITGGWWKGGVKKAVDEFIATGLVKKVKIANCQFILQKK